MLVDPGAPPPRVSSFICLPCCPQPLYTPTVAFISSSHHLYLAVPPPSRHRPQRILYIPVAAIPLSAPPGLGICHPSSAGFVMIPIVL